MSCLAAFRFESVTSATAEIFAQIKKAIGTVPNTFAAIGDHGSAAFKQVPAADAVPYLHIIVKRSTSYAAVVAAGLVLFGCFRQQRRRRGRALALSPIYRLALPRWMVLAMLWPQDPTETAQRR
jgi:hypothetical protein